MRHSVKFRFFLVICAIALAFVGVLSMLNLFFYDDYYLYERRGALVEIYRQVGEDYDGDVALVVDMLEEMEGRTGVRLSIFARGGEIKYDSIYREQRGPSFSFGKFMVSLYDFPLGNAALNETNLAELSKNGYTFVTVEEETTAYGTPPGRKAITGFLCLVGLIGGREELLIARIPLAYMEQNSSFNSTFLFIASMLTLLVCILLAWLVSRQFTRPLIQMEEVATAMARLDFSKRYEGRARDEIGRLGQSINRLSDHLEQAIAGLKSANQELAHEVDEKERIDQMRREFIVDVSHELKTPLALIQGYAEGLRAGVTENAADREYYCDIIVDEAQRMNRLVMRLLKLSKLTLGKEIPEPAEVEWYLLCHTVVEKAALLAEEKGLAVEDDGVSDKAWADPDMLEQVVTNYVSNAIRYTPPGGHIRLYTVQTADGGCELSVENEGEQIPADELELIFEKFYRTDKARTRESGGTGIGLSIVQAIAVAHGGACGAENLTGGVRFWFRLPPQTSGA